MPDKPQYYYRQSAVIPYIKENHDTKVLLVTTQKKKKGTLPKGIIEPGLSAHESAAREAYEEAGVRGLVEESVFDRFQYDKWGGTCDVQVFLMEISEVLNQWPEQNQRRRELVDACQAHLMIGRESMKPVLRKFCRMHDKTG